VAELTPADMKDIQGFVVSGYAHLSCVSYSLLRIDDKVAARRWLGNLANEITTSEGKQEHSCLNVALTHQGLAKLGLADDALETFSRPFIEGMATPHRSRILGDADENEPTRWNWGTDDPAKAVHVLLLVFAKDEPTIANLIKEQTAKFTQNGLSEVLTLAAGRQPSSHEHFGFADGMGQPAIEGTFQTKDAAARNIIKAGEILLSYVNDYDKPANSPMVSLTSDKTGLLPPVIEGTTDDPSSRRDLGRNGTYLVFRQLQQHPAKFYHYLDEATRKPNGELDPVARAWLAAKMVGRWPDGAPLVLSPDGDNPALGMEDDFGFRDSDARGFKCPIGSHIRRSNPRDSIGPDGPTALKTANRHRILRRGRSYGHRPDDRRIDDEVDRGLHFLCLNSDIERQFEFVQQTWVNNPVFGGLDGEVDPLIGNIKKADPDADPADADAIFTVPADPLRTRVHKLERFVTVKGGAYFFLPSMNALRYLSSL